MSDEAGMKTRKEGVLFMEMFKRMRKIRILMIFAMY